MDKVREKEKRWPVVDLHCVAVHQLCEWHSEAIGGAKQCSV